MRVRLISSAIMLAGLVGMSGPVMADTITETRDLPAFSKLSVNGSIDVDVSVGESQSVTIRADDSEIDRIRTKVENDTLVIRMKGNFRNSRNMLATIKVPDFSAIAINGSSDADIRNIDSENFKIKINGSGDVAANGQCTDARYYINGSGDISAHGLKCESASVRISGSGDADVHASSDITVSISGSGDVSATGRPAVKKVSVSGSGSFEMQD